MNTAMKFNDEIVDVLMYLLLGQQGEHIGQWGG